MKEYTQLIIVLSFVLKSKAIYQKAQRKNTERERERVGGKNVLQDLCSI